MKRNIFYTLALFFLTVSFTACNDYETYGEKKDKERKIIREFIADEGISVISESKFHEQSDVTDLTKNEFVYLDNTGVYMQIVREGCGTKLQDGENCDLMVRFMEMCLQDSTALYNDTSPYDADVMNIKKSGSTYTASFTQGMMYNSYGATVPSGWLVPFNYIKVGRDGHSPDEQISKVRLIIPHTQGHSVATSYVYPYYYEITFERKIDIQQ